MQLLFVPASAVPEGPRPIRLLFTGDNLMGGRIGTLLATVGPEVPYAAIRPIFAAADFRFGNLECPLTTAADPTLGKSETNIDAGIDFIFKGDPTLSAAALTSAGFDCMTVANNHAMDYQAGGMLETLATLDAAGILHVGGGATLAEAKRPVVLEIGGQRIGIVAASMINPPHSGADATHPGTWALPKCWTTELGDLLQGMRVRCDYLIFTVHWGVEATNQTSDYQREVARQALAAGADLVVGHHPHVLQPVESLESGDVAYSLGNFCFSGKASELPSAILAVDLVPNAAPQLSLIPLLIKRGVPNPTRAPWVVRYVGNLAPGIPLDLTWAPAPGAHGVQSP